MEDLTDEQLREMNDSYRDREPREPFIEAFEQAIRLGGVDGDLREQMVDSLYLAFPERKRELGGEPADNGLMKNVERREFELRVNVSEKLYKQQPIGVLLRPIDDRVRRAGEAVVYRIDVFAEDVRPNVMPHYHYSLRVQPTPLWLAKWVGEDGYPTL